MSESHKKSKEERKKKFLSKSNFAKNAVILLDKASEIVHGSESPDDMKPMLDAMLHSILFLGNIHASGYEPEDIFGDVEMLTRTKKEFQDPFIRYKTHMAVRTPFSYFLELFFTKYNGYNDEQSWMDALSDLLKDCKKSGDSYPLISTVICMCKRGESRYVGASLSCEGDREREIMTAVSCLKVWHPKVSSAVMSLFPDDTGNIRHLKLPDTVTCTAYGRFKKDPSWKEMPPCKRCSQLYSLFREPDDPGDKNPPGNCAETEGISNLLHGEMDVSEQTTVEGGVYEGQELIDRGEALIKWFEEKIKPINQKRKSVYHLDELY